MMKGDRLFMAVPALEASKDVSAQEVNGLLAEHWASTFGEERLAACARRFAAEDVVVIREACPPVLTAAIQAEACAIIDRHGVTHRRLFQITDNTPRSMTTVGQPVIKAEGPLIDAFYFAPELLRLTSAIAGEELHTCPYPGEHYVISRLAADGDTHGWHWDDYTYGIILVLEAPDYRNGGFVQAVAGTSWDKQDPDVYGALLNGVIRSYAPESGDAYLIKTDTTMHRVHPIRGQARRTIVNMTLASTADLGRQMTHETNDILFGGAPAAAEQR
jgi:hypothetical protein